MKILVTGGAGYIGSHTAVELAQAGYEIVIIDNLCNSDERALAGVRKIIGTDFAFYRADVRDEETLRKIFAEHRPAGIMHFAGLKAVGESVQKPTLYYGNNLGSTISLLNAMAEPVPFIFSSSATVYRPDNPMPLSETMPLGPINPYGQTKFMCEQILQDAAIAEPGFAAVLLRYFNPVGAHESGLIGENPLGVPNNLMPFIAQTARGIQKTLRVFGNDYDTPDGTGVRDYIHVVDLAKGHVKALEYASKNPGAHVINLGTGTGISVLEMVENFKKANSVEVPYEIAPRRAGDAPVSYADPARAEELLGWRAEKGLVEMCVDTWRYQKTTLRAL